MRHLLLVVHPGSCCGSADFNCGEEIAAAIRDALTADLDGWNGAVAVIDGDLSLELRQRAYRGLGAALETALERAAGSGLPAIRIRGCSMEDFNQVRAAASLADSLALGAGDWNVEVTGAWYEPDGTEGCVNSVVEALARVGVSATVRPSAAMLDAEPTPIADSAFSSAPCI
jgi:hypothetical protein